MGGRARWALAITLLALAGGAATPTAAGAAPVPYDDWNPGFIGFPSNMRESPRANCAGGSDACIDRTIGEMWRRFHEVVPSCGGNAIFSLTYLRVTEDVRTGVSEEFWPDHDWINYQDAIFARAYFETYDNWAAGRMDLVPQSWRIAFGASAAKEVQGLGSLLLSMNAHVNRDFPYVLYHAGLVRPDGRSRKEDHDGFGSRLRALYKPMLTELSRRFDDSIDNYDIPGTVADDDALFSLLTQWRELAWQFAKDLEAADTDAERRAVGERIEQNANFWANLIYTGSKYPPGTQSANVDNRDARCARHGGQRGEEYPRGADVASLAGRTAKLGGRSLRVPLACPDGIGPCAGTVKVRAPGSLRLLEKVSFRLGPGERHAQRVRLSRRAAAALRGRDAAGVVRVGVTSKLGPGVAETERPRLRLR